MTNSNEKLFKKLRRLGREPKPDREAKRSRWREQLLDADRTVRAWLTGDRFEAGQVDHRDVLALSAILAMRLARWELAAQRWRAVAAHDAQWRSDALLGLAICYLKAGDEEEAARWIARLEELESDGRKRIKKVAVYKRKAVERGLAGWRGHQAAAEVAEALVGGEAVRARGKLTEALDACEASPAVRELAGDCLDAVLEPERPNVGSVPEGAHRGLVVISGFGWSGSGAITDWLLDHSGVSLPFGNGFEAALLHRAGGLRDLLRAADQGPEERKHALARFLLGPVVGLVDTSNEGARITWQRSLARWVKDDADTLSALQGACRILAAGWLGRAHSEAESVVREFLRRVPGLHDAAGSGLRILNNVPHAQHLDLLRLLPEARAVAMIRDPRDQFTARRLESRKEIRLESFCRGLKRKAKKFNRAMKNPGIGERVRLVDFESFVRSAECRRGLAEWLGVSGEAVQDKKKPDFDPQESAANIGLFQRFLSAEERAAIEQACAKVKFAGQSPFKSDLD